MNSKVSKQIKRFLKSRSNKTHSSVGTNTIYYYFEYEDQDRTLKVRFSDHHTSKNRGNHLDVICINNGYIIYATGMTLYADDKTILTLIKSLLLFLPEINKTLILNKCALTKEVEKQQKLIKENQKLFEENEYLKSKKYDELERLVKLYETEKDIAIKKKKESDLKIKKIKTELNAIKVKFNDIMHCFNN